MSGECTSGGDERLPCVLPGASRPLVLCYRAAFLSRPEWRASGTAGAGPVPGGAGSRGRPISPGRPGSAGI
jgi:hypothetical protein